MSNKHLSSNNPSNARYPVNSQCLNDAPAIKISKDKVLQPRKKLTRDHIHVVNFQMNIKACLNINSHIKSLASAEKIKHKKSLSQD